ncbi:MAG: (2Fe-2S)-binding protein [Azonexus sp.]|jgi:isoquinoline 1-oxidoreductase alpha subunit|nr:(2Fe-2S)-binding protein [Azonexus sp.]
MVNINVNGEEHSLDVDPAMPLLWALREELQLTGAKFGCGVGLCGACMVHLDGVPVRSCSTPLAEAANRRVTTIEGLDSAIGKTLQDAWVDENVAQCGYCQSGQIMSAAALVAANPQPSDKDIEAAMSGNLCRCGSYQRIKRAIHSAAKAHASGEKS